jgi:hypothetical protein
MSDPYVVVDFYKQCQDAISAMLMAKLPQYLVSDWQLTDNEYDFNRGADYFILYRPGQIPLPNDQEADGEILEMHWQVICNVAVRFIQKNLQWTQFGEFRAAVWHVLANPRNSITLNNNIWRVLSVTSSEDPSYWDFSDTVVSKNKSNFMLQPLVATVKQRVVFL